MIVRDCAIIGGHAAGRWRHRNLRDDASGTAAVPALWRRLAHERMGETCARSRLVIPRLLFGRMPASQREVASEVHCAEQGQPQKRSENDRGKGQGGLAFFAGTHD